jgi:segregation and condensation protein A
MDDLQFDLDNFHGPLDLLLHLVKRNEVDPRDVPVAKITEQFQAYLQVLDWLDIEQAGEFVVMASTLLEIKSRMLLPQDGEAPAEEADPRRELVRQLLEYRKFKDAAAALERLAEAGGRRVARQPPEEPARPGPPVVRPVELWDLVSAFGRLMRETLALQPKQIVVDETPQHVYAAQIAARLAASERVAFEELFTPPHNRARLVGLFLALLELIKGRQVRVEQAEPFGPIWVCRVGEGPVSGG